MQLPSDATGLVDGLGLLGQAGRDVFGDFGVRTVELVDGANRAVFAMSAIEAACRPNG